MSDVGAIAGPSSPPRSPKFPPLLSASLYPPPPPCYQHFTPLNLHFHSILTEHWPAKGSEEESKVYSEELNTSDDVEGWTPRLKLQRRILLTHASSLDSLPESVRSLHPELKTDEELRDAIASLGRLDLKLEMDPPDLEVLKSEKVGGYMVFGQWWPIPPKESGLEEAGVRKLYDDETLDEEGRTDRRPALLLLLRTFVATYLKLLSLLQYPPSYTSIRTLHTATSNFSLSTPAQPGPGQGGESQEEISWHTSASLQWSHMRTLVINIQELLNRARPEQARCNLEAEMRRRVEKRKADVTRIREVLKGSREKVKQLREAAALAVAGETEVKRTSQPAGSREAKVKRVKIETAAGSEGTNGIGETKQDMEVD